LLEDSFTGESMGYFSLTIMNEFQEVY